MDKAIYNDEEKGEEDIGEGFINDEIVASSEEEVSSEEEKVSKKKINQHPKKESTKKVVKPDFDGKTRREVLLEINEIAKDCRPLGNVKAIMKSPNREKEHMVTLMIQDQERLEDETFLILITGQSNGG